MLKEKKKIRVVAAVMCNSIKEKSMVYATARGYGEFKGQWEFPGGKIEEGNHGRTGYRNRGP